MAEHHRGELDDVVGQDELAVADRGEGLGRPDQLERGARARTEAQVARLDAVARARATT